MRANLILPCGGSGNRSGLSNKLLASIDPVGTPVIVVTIAKFLDVEEVTRIILPCAKATISDIKSAICKYYNDELISGKIILCLGGGTRTDSVKSALKLVDTTCELTIIHDGARPFVTAQVIKENMATALEHGAAIAAVPTTDTIATVNSGDEILSIPERASLVNLQTPQTFLTNSIINAYLMVKDGEVFTDDSSVYAAKIGVPKISKGDSANIKLTYANDFSICGDTRVGVGYDTHTLVEGRDLILGGVKIPHTKGLLGHSDADALIHAIMDALLTACNQRDIGSLFPDTDEKYRGIASTLLLKNVHGIILSQGYIVNNISAVIMAQKPKLAKFIQPMIATIADILEIPHTAIGISATTTEGIGFIGREEGIAVHAACTIIKTKLKN